MSKLKELALGFCGATLALVAALQLYGCGEDPCEDCGTRMKVEFPSGEYAVTGAEGIVFDMPSPIYVDESQLFFSYGVPDSDARVEVRYAVQLAFAEKSE